MGMGFAPTWLRQVSPLASQNHFNHWQLSHRLIHSVVIDNQKSTVAYGRKRAEPFIRLHCRPYLSTHANSTE